MNSLLQQMREVQALQFKMGKYYNIYKQQKTAALEENQFMDVPSIIDTHSRSQLDIYPQDPLFQPKIQQPITYNHYQSINQPQYLPIFESQIIKNTKSQVDMSRIFQEIVLGDQVMSHQLPFHVELQFENNLYSIQLNKKDQYSLSNFNSFSHQQESIPQFTELVEKIQGVVGKIISQKGIIKIIEQIKNNCRQISQYYQAQHSSDITQKNGSCVTDSSLMTTLTEESRHNFDKVLNNQAFQRKKSKVSRPLEMSSISESSNIDWADKKSESHNFNKRNGNKVNKEGRCDKQNMGEDRRVRKGIQKEMKIMKKGREMTMLYTDSKQVDQFCITNKIFGKQKEKIMRAVTSSKTLLTLE